MTRRILFAIPLAAWCRAAEGSRAVREAITDAAASLSAGDAGAFLKAFDPRMPGYAKLRENVTALVAQGELHSFIDPLEEEGDERRRVAEFYWTLRIHRSPGSASYTSRQRVVKCTLEKQGRNWRIVGLEPMEFFAPGN